MNCLICNQPTNFIFNKRILNKYDIKYYQCPYCEYLQTEKPFWLRESYKDTISVLDVGILKRNIQFSKITSFIISNYLASDKEFIDYGGGYGIFTRLMRDNGFSFFRDEPFTKNIFAIGFDAKKKSSYELLTAMEVFEHLDKPITTINKMVGLSSNILFSTELLPMTNVKNWWYLLPETGQHVGFYSTRTLYFIAKKYDLFLYSNGLNLHLLSKKKLLTNPFRQYEDIGRFKRLFKRIEKVFFRSKENKNESLIPKDFQDLKKLYSL